MKWNLRLIAAQREIWRASDLHRLLGEAGLTISAGKMSHLWSGQPVTIRLDDLEVICAVLDCAPNDLLVREPGKAIQGSESAQVAKAVGENPVLLRRRDNGRTRPPL